MMATYNDVRFISLNMRGFNQCSDLLKDVTSTDDIYVICLQEHWLLPDSLVKLQQISPDYVAVSTSAMSSKVGCGPIYGRPFGGLSVVLHKSLVPHFQCVLASERLIAVTINDILLINVYMPCVGTIHRVDLIDCLVGEIESVVNDFPSHSVMLLGDFNCVIECVCPTDEPDNICYCTSDRDCQSIIKVLDDHKLIDVGMNYNCKRATYYDALSRGKRLDYIFVNNCVTSMLVDFAVLDVHNNFSDHCPVMATMKVSLAPTLCDDDNLSKVSAKPTLRWDHADLSFYYQATEFYLRPLLEDLIKLCPDISDENTLNELHSLSLVEIIESFYTKLVCLVKCAALSTVPFYPKQVAKKWWNIELSLRKQQSLAADRMWKDSGRPSEGSLFDARKECRVAYRAAVRKAKFESDSYVSARLQSSLSSKHGKTFWSVWRANFNNRKRNHGLIYSTPTLACKKFADAFSKINSSAKVDHENSRNSFDFRKSTYVGLPDPKDVFDVELIESAIKRLHRGTACGADGITVEHVIFAHPVLISILLRLFRLMYLSSTVPTSFCQSYVVPVPKNKDNAFVKCVDDFRAISINSVLAKIFEFCLLEKFKQFLSTRDQQFGFKKSHGTSCAVFTLRKVIDHYVERGSTVNICTLDISKAFDKIDHNLLLMKLMDRKLPAKFIDLLDYWLSHSTGRVKWCDLLSDSYKFHCGVRQGSCLSPALFQFLLMTLLKDAMKLFLCLGLY